MMPPRDESALLVGAYVIGVTALCVGLGALVRFCG